MAELALLDKAFSNIMMRLVETGQAPTTPSWPWI